jgi:ribosomal protein S18 acetylase RimI-like enzyme
VSARPGAARRRVVVRRFRSGDVAAVAALWDAVFPDDRPWATSRVVIARKRAQRDGLVWVATCGARIVGAVMAGWDGQRGWIYHLAVDPDERRRGVGRALVVAAERALAARGCPKINLQVLVSNRDVVAFYERLGWLVEHRVSMGKTLATRRPRARRRPAAGGTAGRLP